LTESKQDIYRIENLPKSIIILLDGIKAPQDLPKYSYFLNNIILVIDTILNLVPAEKKSFLQLLKTDLKSQLEINISDIDHSNISDLSSTYYLLTQFPHEELTNFFKLGVSVFLHQIMKLDDQGEPTFHHNLSHSLQNITRRFLTSTKIIPSVGKTIFEIYLNLQERSGNEISELEKLIKLKAIFEKIGKKITKEVDADRFRACGQMVIFSHNIIAGDEDESSSRDHRYPHLRAKNFKTLRKKGKPPEIEYQESINIEILEAIPDETSYKSAAELKHWTRTRTAMLNNYPQEHPSVLNDLEASALYNFLLKRYVTQNGPEKKSCFSVLLMLIIGLDFTWLKYVKIVTHLPQLVSEHTIYITTAGVIFYTVPTPKEKKVTNKKTKTGSQFHSKTLKLAMPSNMIPIIQEQYNVTATDNSLNIDNDSMNKTFDAVRHKLGRHFTRYTVRDYAFNLYYRHTNDEVLATFLCPITNYTMPTGCYYTSITSNKLNEIHSKALSIAFDETTKITTHSYEFVGSDILVTKEEITELLDKLKLNLHQYSSRSLRTSKQLIKHHNDYCKYVATIMLLLTGHRPVNDIFDDKNYLFIQNNFCFIGDKASSYNNVLRLCPLADVLVEQLKLYEQHLSNLAFRLHKLDPALAENISRSNTTGIAHSAPFLFIISKDNGLEGINERTLEDYWGNDFQHPANFYRHHLSSKFLSLNIPREKISYLLGHISTGQNPLAITSTLNTMSWLQEIAQYLNLISAELSVESIKGIEKGKSQVGIEPIQTSEISSIFGTAQRQENRMNIMKKVRVSVNSYFQKFLPRVIDKTAKTYDAPTNTEIESLKNYIDKLPVYQVAKSYTLSQKILNRYSKKFNRKSNRIWYVYTHDESIGLSLDSPMMLQQQILIKDLLQTNVLKILTNDTHYNFSYLMSTCYLYALSTGLSRKVEPKNFINSIKAPFIKKFGAVFVSITINGHVVYWAPNNISLILISLLRDKWPKVNPKEKNITHNIDKILSSINHNIDKKITFKYFLRINKLGYLLRGSPSEQAQSDGEVFFTQSESDHSKKMEVDKHVLSNDEYKLNTTKVNIPLFGEFLSKLRQLLNKLPDIDEPDKKDKLKSILNQAKKEACNLTQLISAWGSYMLKKGTRKTQTPAVSTVINYTLVNSKILSDILGNIALLSLDDVELSTLFEMIIELNSSNKNSISALLSFNDFLAESFQREDIYLGDIAWKNSGIDTRTFSAEEVLTLLNDDIFTPDELFFMQILAEVGCRESEAYSLLSSDFDLIAQCIQFRKNKLDSLKNSTSRRPFSFKRLSNGLVEKINDISGKGVNSAIFNVNEEDGKQSSYKMFCLNLNTKIRKVLNNNLSLKHFRHFRARVLFLNRDKFSLRDTWQVSALMGHASPKTTQRHYIQNIFKSNAKIPMTDEELSIIFKIKLATIRQHRKRYFQYEPVALANANLSIKYITETEGLYR
jgi:integrase